MAVQRPTKVGIAFVDPSEIVEPETIQTQLALRGRIVLLAGLLVGVVLAVYAVALHGSFIYFDDKVITTNGLLRTFRGVWPIWIHPTILPHYQPLAYTALLLEFQLFSARLPGGYLAVNLLLHATNIVLLWTLLRKLEIRGALAAAALVAAHPINVEAVAWISQQPLLLSGAFGLWAALVYLRFAGINPQPQVEGTRLGLPRSPRMLYGLACALFLAALACHASAVILPVVLLTIIWWERGRIGERDLMPLIPLAVLALIWTGITIYTQTRAWSTRGANIQILAAGRVVCTYFWHLIWPVNLAFAYPKWAAESAIFDALMAVAIAVVLAGAWMLRRRAGRGPVAGILLFLVALLPALIFRSDVESSSHVADHLAYLAAMALIVGIVSIIPRTPLSWGMWPGRIAVGAICILLAVASIGHINDYQSSQNLWNAALRADPGSATAHNYLGVMELEQNHDLIAAMEHFEAASQRDPEDARTKIYMGRVYEKKSEIGKALMRYQEAARLAPEDPDTHFALAGAMELQGDSDGAIREYERALELRPDDVMANNNLGLLHFERGEVTQATARLQHAIEINPSFFPAYMNLANIFFDWGFATLDQAKITRSAQLLEQAEKIAVDPQTKSVVKAHAAVYSRKLALRQGAGDAEREEQMARSESLLRQAIVLNPAFPEAQWELGRTLLLRGKTDEAIARLEKAVKMDQNDERFVRSLRAAREGNLTEALN